MTRVRRRDHLHHLNHWWIQLLVIPFLFPLVVDSYLMVHPGTSALTKVPNKTLLSASRDHVNDNMLPLSSSSTKSNTTTTTRRSSLPDPHHEITLLFSWAARLQKTVEPLVLLVSFSLLLALVMVAYEDYGAANLWPSRHMIVETTRLLEEQASSSVAADTTTMNTGSSTHAETTTAITNNNNIFGARSIHGLAFGKSERLGILVQQQQQQQEDNINTNINSNSDDKNNNNMFATTEALLPEIRAYNEVMEEHRLKRVSRWQQQQPTTTTTTTTTSVPMELAVEDLQQILQSALALERLVVDYQWDQVHAVIQGDIVPRLEPAATVVRQQLQANQKKKNNNININDSNMYNIGYEEIGFDWGSCAWRHCGALADAQEALDELDHLLGVLEPPECLFCLNIVERSIRDMLAVVPREYHALEGVPAYIPYQSAHGRAASQGDGDELWDDRDVLDQEYLKMLQELRSTDDD